MTGFGRKVADIDREGQLALRLVVEIRSVNHRGFDLKIRAPEPDPTLEIELTRLVREAVERGAVTVAIRDDRPAHAFLDVDRVRDMHTALERIRLEARVTAPVDLATVAAFMASSGIDGTGMALHGGELWSAVRPAVEGALAELVSTRKAEGAALRQDLATRADRLAALVETLEIAVRPVPERFARRLQERLAALRDVPGYDPGRTAQEVALLADRLDVSEEIVRLRTHLQLFRTLLDAEVPVGRKLDFVLQEMGREINTVGSKSQDAAVSGYVIEGKAELEKIREQAQNIE
jgi:uncharacterized protein (TIGR00255 family)